MRASLPGTRPESIDNESAASRHVRQMFSHIAPRYDLLNHLLSLRFDVSWRKRLVQRFSNVLASPQARILDLCCGTGDLAIALAHDLDGAHDSRSSGAEPLVAVDFAHPMLRRASSKAESASRCFRRIEFIEADALCLPFSGGAFDLVTTAFGFRNLVNYAAGVRELHRVLAPGGWLAILEFAEPESALVGRLFQLYFHHVLPAIGGVISGNPGAYNYLPQSVARFPSPKELVDLVQGCGFSGVEYDSWTGGIVTLHTARVTE